MIKRRWQSPIEHDDWEEAITTNRRVWLEGGDNQQQKTIMKRCNEISQKVMMRKTNMDVHCQLCKQTKRRERTTKWELSN